MQGCICITYEGSYGSCSSGLFVFLWNGYINNDSGYGLLAWIVSTVNFLMNRKFKYQLQKSSSNQCSKSASLSEILLLKLRTVLVACQAEKELQPWIAKDDNLGQKMWRINQRIVKLIVELMRNHESAESLVIVASSSDLLLRATDGMLVDGEACTLPQLEVVYFNIGFSLHYLANLILTLRMKGLL